MNSTGARDDILARIRRRSVAPVAPLDADYASIVRDYVQAGTHSDGERLDLFRMRLHDYGVGVYDTTSDAIAAALSGVLAGRNKRRLLIPPGFPRHWLPDSCTFVVDNGLAPAELDRSEGVVTACAIAIAVTGTIVLAHSAAEGRRALTLVPDYHLCIVGVDQIVETVPEGIRRIAATGAGLITTIAGPSATADIEMTRVKGVHGPRTLDVIIAG
jgi:L-lactate dehydrogenase complex protein LldG